MRIYCFQFNSSAPSSEFCKRVSQKLRYSFRPLYTAAPASSLQLSAAVFAKIISDKIIHAAQNQKVKVRYAWEPIAESIISGVLVCLAPTLRSALVIGYSILSGSP